MASRINSATSTLKRVLTDRVDAFPPWVVMVQFFIGIGWFRAAAEKLISPRWWTGAELTDFLAEQDEWILAWYRPVVDHLIGPQAAGFALVVLVLQLVAAVGIFTGRFMGVGLLAGIAMNINFVAAGAVNPSAFYLACQGALALWLVEHSTQRLTAYGLVAAGAFGGALSIVSLPLIGTVHPMDVIEDSAAVFAYGGALTVLACVLAARQIHRREPTLVEALLESKAV